MTVTPAATSRVTTLPTPTMFKAAPPRRGIALMVGHVDLHRGDDLCTFVDVDDHGIQDDDIEIQEGARADVLGQQRMACLSSEMIGGIVVPSQATVAACLACDSGSLGR